MKASGGALVVAGARRKAAALQAARTAGALLVALMLLIPLGLLQTRRQPASINPPGPPLGLSESELRLILSHSPLPPPPPDPTNAVADDPRAARLGQRLFFDQRLSAGQNASCVTCHDPGLGLADGLPSPDGTHATRRNALSIWNSAYQSWLFWDGRADSLWAQALHPIEDPLELGSTRVSVARLLLTDEHYRAEYEALFEPLPEAQAASRWPPRARPTADPAHPDGAAWRTMSAAQQTLVNRIFAGAGKSISAFERQFVSRRAPFDVFVEGLRENDLHRMAALSPQALAGLRLFVGRANCSLCHAGPNFSDGAFHSVRVAPADGRTPRDAGRYDGASRVLADEFNAAGPHSDEPAGRAAQRLAHTRQRAEDWGKFRTPSLRNVARTAPYMHQGQFDSLQRVIEHYSTLDGALPLGHHQQDRTLVPLELTPDEAAALVAFLESLTDERVPPELLVAPPPVPVP